MQMKGAIMLSLKQREVKAKQKRYQAARLCEGHSMGKWQITDTRTYLFYPDDNKKEKMYI